MCTVRLIREVSSAGRSGPRNGQYALQKALRERAPAWLRVGGLLRAGEIPWFWCWKDGARAAACAAAGRPFVVGPNVLFAHSRAPCRLEAERAICNAASCRLLFTESAWYRDLIESQRGPANRAPIVVWPYPIDPPPGGPLPAQYDLLIYEKGRDCGELITGLRRHFDRVRLLKYGRFRRRELFAAARRSRCCVYLSDDDRGPLALAEILLAGCPTVGVPRGAPFIRDGQTGIVLLRFDLPDCLEAVMACRQFDRRGVADLAAAEFDTKRTLQTILRSLEAVFAEEEAGH